jgi:hypothetical protein
MIKKLLLIVLLLILIASLSYRIDISRSPHELIGELMYFPSGLAVRVLSIGYYAPLADVIWLRFIQYYGEHRITDQRYDLMYHILDILTTLDPDFDHAYTLGALMLTHDAQKPDEAKKLLKKGMQQNPFAWRYPFVYGFIHYVFLVDYSVAATYFRLASSRAHRNTPSAGLHSRCTTRSVTWDPRSLFGLIFMVTPVTKLNAGSHHIT